jgi:hypothetical protein
MEFIVESVSKKQMITNIVTTPVFLSEEEARLFLSFQKHHHLIGLLESIKAFDIRGGSITIKFDNEGKIKVVEKKEYFEA